MQGRKVMVATIIHMRTIIITTTAPTIMVKGIIITITGPEISMIMITTMATHMITLLQAACRRAICISARMRPEHMCRE
jgi:hypothetical protein